MNPSVVVRSPVVVWTRKVHPGGFTNWEPELECGHVRYGGFHPYPDLPVELECYECAKVARNSLVGSSSKAGSGEDAGTNGAAAKKQPAKAGAR